MEIQQQFSNKPEANECEYISKGIRCNKSVVEKSFFCEEHTNDKDIDIIIHKSILNRFLQHIQGLWTRSYFYFIIQAGLLTVFVGTLSSRYSFPFDLVLGFLGLLLASIWFVACLLDIGHLNKWRSQLIKIDRVVDKRQHFSEIEEPVLSQLTPAKLNQLFPSAFAVVWIVLLATLFWISLAF